MDEILIGDNNMIILQYRIYRSDLELNPDLVYCFGDNDDRVGLGGQAAEMRGEHNAIGIRTKKHPINAPTAYYSDDEYDECIAKINEDFDLVETLLEDGKHVVMPTEGFGTGLSELKERAPNVLAHIESRIVEFVEKYG
jgi:hypothetical protein